jgi:hypothetical protein
VSDGHNEPDPTDEPQAPQFDAFAADMLQSLEQLEEHPPAKGLTAAEPVPADLQPPGRASDIELAPPRNSSRDSIGVCLDYAAGTCTRNHCKYPHPDPTALHWMRAQYGHQGVVCEVYALTGYCRFGANCTKMHPAFTVPPCVPSHFPLPLLVGAEIYAQPQAPALPMHVTFRANPPPVRTVAANDGHNKPDPSEYPQAPQFDAFATDMLQLSEQLEEHLPAKRPATTALVPN